MSSLANYLLFNRKWDFYVLRVRIRSKGQFSLCLPMERRSKVEDLHYLNFHFVSLVRLLMSSNWRFNPERSHMQTDSASFHPHLVLSGILSDLLVTIVWVHSDSFGLQVMSFPPKVITQDYRTESDCALKSPWSWTQNWENAQVCGRRIPYEYEIHLN